MKVTIEADTALAETEVLIRCSVIDESVRRLASIIELQDMRIIGMHEGERHVIAAKDVLYFESVDAHTFAYLKENVLEVHFKLYELAEKLGAAGFEQASKSCIVNLNKIASMAPYVGGRLIATLDNGEDIVASRKFTPKIKQRIGL